MGHLQSYTCDRCGYREWYARRIDDLSDDPDVERVRMPPAATQLMRMGWPCWKCHSIEIWLPTQVTRGGILLSLAVCGACGFVEWSVESVYELGRSADRRAEAGMVLRKVTDDGSTTPCGLCSSANIWELSFVGEHLEICNACGHVVWVARGAASRGGN